MINPVANQEAIHSATYVDNYLDCVENLPDDLQKHLSRVRELDVNYRACVREVESSFEAIHSTNQYSDNPVATTRRARAVARMQQSLICAQELGDEKLQLVQEIQDLIDNKSRQLDQDYKNLDYSKDEPVAEVAVKELAVVSSPVTPTLPTPTNLVASSSSSSTGTTLQHTSSGERASKRARRTKNDIQESIVTESIVPLEQSPVKQTTSTVSVTNSTHKKGHTGGGKKKKRKSRNTQQAVQQARDRSNTPPPEEPDTIDPDEPTYCLCDQISFGEMILCDNDLCPIEWFHFSCVALSTKPKGKWFCPKCRGDRPNVMKPKAQFLKELERYNKEREEKS